MRLKNEIRTAYFVSVKYFKRNYKLLLFLTLILSFSFVNIVFFSSINKGLTSTLNSQVISYTTGDIIIEPKEGALLLDNVEYIVNKVLTVPGIIDVSTRYDQVVSVKKGDKISGTRLISIDPEKEYQVSQIEAALIDGKSIGRYETGAIMMGVEIANSQGSRTLSRGYGIDANVGDTIEIEFDNAHKKDYVVKGIFDTRFWESDFFIIVNHKDIESFLNLRNKGSYIMVKVDDASKVDYYKREILKFGMDVEVSTWQEKTGFVQKISDSLGLIEVIMFLAGILIASVTIFITMRIQIHNRMKFIGIMRAIGISRKTIVMAYLLQVLFYCFIGITIGILMTGLIIRYFISHPLNLPMGLVVPNVTNAGMIVAASGIIIASLISVLIPSLAITKKNIIFTIFRGEK